MLNQGPWMIVGHYLVVQRWRPKFDPFDDNFKKLTIKVYVLELPTEYYNKNLLWHVGMLLGE